MKFIISSLFVLIFSISAVYFVFAATPDELKKNIDEKTRELEKINDEIVKTQNNLTGLEQKSKTLNNEIKRADYQINQLNLTIKSSEIKIEKYGLEINSLEQDISEKENNIGLKKGIIGGFLRELQEKDHENLLIVFLKNLSLADSLQESEAILKLNDNLTEEINSLQLIKGELAVKLTETSDKKKQKESENKNLKYRKSITEEQKQERKELLTQTKNQEKVYEQQLSEIEKIQAEISAEVEKMEAELRKLIDPNLLPLPRPGVLLWPVKGGKLTQGYGSTAFALRNYRGQHHNGIDIGGVPIGSEVLAASDGSVINAGDQDQFRGCRRAAYGKFVVIKHENALTTLYAHLSGYPVNIGDKVKQGDIIGYLGKTGWATGPHLHFTVFASQTLSPPKSGYPEGAKPSRVCGPMPVGGDLDPNQYLQLP